MLLRKSEERGTLTWAEASRVATAVAGGDPRRAELAGMIATATKLAGGDKTPTPIAR